MLDERKTRELREAALDDLRKYDDLRANALEIIAVCDKRLELLGAKDTASNAIPLLRAEDVMKTVSSQNGNGRTLKSYIEEVLEESSKPLKARQVWEFSYQLGARTTSANPPRVTDTILREMVRKGQAIRVGTAYAKNNKAQAAT